MSKFTNNLDIPISSVFGLLCYRDMLIKLISENKNENILLLADEHNRLTDKLIIIEDKLISLNIFIL